MKKNIMDYEKPFAPGTSVAMLFFMLISYKKLVAGSTMVSIVSAFGLASFL